MSLKTQPRIPVTSCNRTLAQHPFHVTGRKYADTVRLSGRIPFIMPRPPADQVDAVPNAVHGVMISESQSEVDPNRFCEMALDATLPLDPGRDEARLQLSSAAPRPGKPLFAIRRGLPVAPGGKSHQTAHMIDQHEDHREDREAPAERQLPAAHVVQVQPGGVPDALLGQETFAVNSLHDQAVDRLADALQVDARARDCVVEAVSVLGCGGFNLGVQWHPAWPAADNPVSTRLHKAFYRSCHDYRDRRLGA